MKKMLSILLVSMVAISMLAGCGAKESSTATDTTNTEQTTNGSNETTTEAAAGSIAKIGLGHVTTIGKSKDLEGDKASGQVDTIMVAAAFDKDGKVVKVEIDNAQSKVDFDKDMQVASDIKAEMKTKVELGDEYGMKKASTIGKEWYEQAKALGDWMVGKSIDEIKGMKTVEKDASHPAVPDEADLTSSVTVSVEGYIAGVVEAYDHAIEVQAGAERLGLGHIVSAAKSKGYSNADGKEVLPAAEVNTIMVATAFDNEGKVAGTIIDNAQTKIDFDKAGKITTDKNGEFKTKVELADEYGMKKASSIGKDWYEQAKALGDWMVGKNVDEIKSMKTKEKDASHPAVPDEAELTSSVTISVESYIAGLVKSFDNAK
ncbi:hypothetical protein BVG16_24265 [Paenibacillus selenitireducens]|uniref:FMN-binding protein n=1 Tax=Paenibacillus selenitireducens TaxID=1324314 RepID=A0A1T2X3E8_9BACL|nr:hypothetical protein [Paenibacillus selenitireducens]OPA74246.1 hypothetical protein BVG16_24265 [Paenibacillus selenitireducens]